MLQAHVQRRVGNSHALGHRVSHTFKNLADLPWRERGLKLLQQAGRQPLVIVGDMSAARSVSA